MSVSEKLRTRNKDFASSKAEAYKDVIAVLQREAIHKPWITSVQFVSKAAEVELALDLLEKEGLKVTRQGRFRNGPVYIVSW